MPSGSRQMQREFSALWSQIDCLFTPAVPVTAPAIGASTVRIQDSDRGEIDEDVRIASTRFARSFNVLGVPAIALPCGFDSVRKPIGLQIISPAFEEARLLRIASAVEDALGLGELIAPPA